jgi:pyruvate/2-oxoglutarate dehydrogenase complex dihydrolipoamide acyltransferase (E2) component
MNVEATEPLLSVNGTPISRTVNFDPVQRLTAERMLQSHIESARVTVLAEADVTELVNLRKKFNVKYVDARKNTISITSIYVKIIARALSEHPHLNATLVGNSLHLLDEININIAIATQDGNLLVPVIHNADRLNIVEIEQLLTDLRDRAKHKKLKPADMRGGTFTVTNGGMFSAIRWTTPILNIPQCAILGLGAITPTVAVYKDEIVIRSMIPLSLTFDHRALNGYPASDFLQTVANISANPESLEFDTLLRDKNIASGEK